jgi:L-fuconolactonase
MASSPVPGSPEWLAIGADEPLVEPDRRIVDPHHHLWPPGSVFPYSLDDLLRDAGSGHRVERTVFVECHAQYRKGGPPELAPVGETEFVAEQAAPSGGLIAGIVAHADLRLANLDEVLDAHEAAGRGLFRGIRDSLVRSDPADGLMMSPGAPFGLCEDAAFQAGVKRLGGRGLTYDTWLYHYQLPELLALARAVPDTLMVLDHFGTPIGVGRYASRREEIFQQWQRDIADVAQCDNVVAKLGGLAMRDNGFGWETAARPPSSDELVDAQRRYYEHTIECFGVERCMFESNFPVDRLSVSYRVLWNAFKKITSGCTPTERDALFAGTATRVYRLAA